MYPINERKRNFLKFGYNFYFVKIVHINHCRFISCVVTDVTVTGVFLAQNVIVFDTVSKICALKCTGSRPIIICVKTRNCFRI